MSHLSVQGEQSTSSELSTLTNLTSLPTDLNQAIVKSGPSTFSQVSLLGGSATQITVSDEATDATCSVIFTTSATGDLEPKSNAGLTFNSSSGVLTATGFVGPLTGNVTGNASGTAATVTVAAQPAITSLGTLTVLQVDNLNLNGNTILASSGAVNITPEAGSAIVLDGTINVDAGVVTGATSITSTTFTGALTGNASTATALQNARTIGGVSFDGTANITVATATGGFTVSGGALALGANDLTMTGSLGTTGARLTKGWFTDLQVTNAIAGSITGNAATVTISAESTDATCSILFSTATTGSLSPSTHANMTFASNTGIATFASTVLTTTDINGGTIDGTTIGASSATTAVITTLTITSMGGNWTNAGRTVADAGILTTVDINGGTVDGTVIGGASAAAGTFTTVGGTTITASTGFALGDGDYVGVTSNETLVFNTAGTIVVTGADLIVADGNGVVSGHSAQLAAGGITPEFQIVGTSTTGVDSTLLIANFSTTATSAATLMFAKSDQGTPGSFALLDSGDTIGGLLWVADDGVDLISEAARIYAYVDNTSGSNDMPGRIVFGTTADGGVAVTDRWIIDSAGAFKPATNDGAALGTSSLGVADIHLAAGGNITTSSGANSLRTIILTAAGGAPTTTIGCGGPTKVEAGTNDVDYWALEFDTTTEERAFWVVQMPDNYDAGTITARFIWTNAAGASTETVTWGIKARGYADSDAIDQAYGTEVTVADTWLAQGDIHISAATTAITIGGSPAGGRPVVFNVGRKTGSDNMAGDARLLAVQIEYGINAYSD